MVGWLVLTSLAVALSGSGNDKTIDAFRYGTDAEARVEWRAGEGSPEVSASNHGLRFPLKAGLTEGRSVWDRRVSLNLSSYDKFVLRLKIDAKAALVPGFTLYFSSGGGWYGASFRPERGSTNVVLSKSDFGVEGEPSGWDKISGIRICSWNANSPLTEFLLTGLTAKQSDVAILLDTRSRGSEQWPTCEGQTKLTGDLLTRIGIDNGVLSDEDAASGALAGRKVVILPHNPNLSSDAQNALVSFMRGGGKVLAFYSVPGRVLQELGVEVVGYARAQYPGQFARVGFQADIEGLPKTMTQNSWNINHARPVSHGAKVVGKWIDLAGKSSEWPALVASDTGAYMVHVLTGDDESGKQRMLLALLGRYMPGLWLRAAKKALDDVGRVGEFETLAELASFVKKSGKAGVGYLNQGRQIEAKARRALADNNSVLSFDLAQRARALMADAYCASVPTKAGELRAAWCHAANGVAGMTWDAALKAMKDGGMNAIFPNMLWGGLAYYRSDLLPVDPSVDRDGDQIALCSAAARKHGIKLHVWKVNWNLVNAPAAFLTKMRQENRTQKTPDGKDIDWLCPSNPRNFELERDSMLEVVRKYDVDGIHFDYIRYPDSNGCFCEGCRERFGKQFGVTVENWPSDVVSGPLRDKYLAFRRSNISRLVKAVSEEARRIKPKIQVSAAVFSNWPDCRDSIGQDWVTWLREGDLDFACPMNYTPSATEYQMILRNQTGAVKRVKPLVSGLGVTLDSWTLPPDQVVRQIRIARKEGADGFILFNLNEYVVREVLPKLRLGATSR